MTKLKKLLVILTFIIAFLGISSNAYASFDSSNIIIRHLPTDMADFIDSHNFHKVDNNFYRGSQPDKKDFQNLAVLGIKTIINLRNEDKDDISKQENIARKFGISYINIPMKASQPPTDNQIAYFFKLLDNPQNLPVYVHCLQGKDRTGIMTALYRIRDYGWNFEQAFSEMKQKGHHDRIFPKHREFLHNFTQNFLFKNK